MKVKNQKSIHKRILTEGPLDLTTNQNINGKHTEISHRCLNQDYLPKIKKTITKQNEPIYLSHNPLKPKLSNNKIASKNNHFYLSTEENSTNIIPSNVSTKKSANQLHNHTNNNNSNYLFNNTKVYSSKNNKLKLLSQIGNQSINNEIQIRTQEASLSKTATKDTTTITPFKHLTNLESITTPEELHLIFVQLVQKAKPIQRRFDIDNESYNEDVIIGNEY